MSAETRRASTISSQVPGMAGLEARFELQRAYETKGAEADLYEVTAQSGERQVAKVYRRGIWPKPEVLDRVQAIDEPAIVKLMEHGEGQGQYYEIAEHVPGGTLQEWINDTAGIGRTATKKVLTELARAIATLHENGIEHRDLKPDNILIRDRSTGKVAIGDFGIASLPQSTIHLTRTARTLLYAAPEAVGMQLDNGGGEQENVAAVHHKASDYWSLGMIMVECLTGQHPLQGHSEVAAMVSITTSDTRALCDGVKEPGWRRLCEGLLRRKPKNRWGAGQIERWLRWSDDPELVVADENIERPMEFAGGQYYTARGLGQALEKHREEALNFWRRRATELVVWIADSLADSEKAQHMEAAIAETADKHAEVALTKGIGVLDPETKPTAFGLELDHESLARRFERVLNGDPIAQVEVIRVLDEGLMELAIEWMDRKDTVEKVWNEAVEKMEKLNGICTAHEVSTDNPSRAISIAILSGKVWGLASKAMAEAGRRAFDAMDSDAMRTKWFVKEVLEGMPTGTAEQLLGFAMLCERAGEEGRSEASQALVRRERNIIRIIGNGLVTTPLWGYAGLTGMNLFGLLGSPAQMDIMVPIESMVSIVTMIVAVVTGAMSLHTYWKPGKSGIWNTPPKPSGARLGTTSWPGAWGDINRGREQLKENARKQRKQALRLGVAAIAATTVFAGILI